MEQLLVLAIAIGTLEMTIKMIVWLWGTILILRGNEKIIQSLEESNNNAGKFIFLGLIINGSLTFVCWYMMINYVFLL